MTCTGTVVPSVQFVKNSMLQSRGVGGEGGSGGGEKGANLHGLQDAAQVLLGIMLSPVLPLLLM